MIKTHVYEIIWIETQINSEFLVKKNTEGEKSQIPILQGRTLDEQKNKKTIIHLPHYVTFGVYMCMFVHFLK